MQLGLVVAGAWAIRLWAILGWQQHQAVQGDQVFYHHQARALADGAGFVNPWAWNATGAEIGTALHPPLYSLYLAAWTVLGVDTPTGHKLASSLLGAGTVLVVGVLAARLGGHAAGILAAVLAAVYPPLWVNDGGLAAESLYALIVALVLWTSYRVWDEPSTAAVAALGALVALATLTRAEALGLYGLLVLPLLVLLPELSLRRRAWLLAWCGLAGLLVMAPWIARNMLTFEHPSLLSNGAGFVIEISNCDQTYAGEHLGYWDVECDRDATWLYEDRYEAARHETEVERAKREVGVTYAREHLARLPLVAAARVGRMWEIYRPFQNIQLNAFFERRGMLPSRVGLAMYAAVLPLAAWGVVLLRRRRETIVPFVALFSSATLTAALSFGITRYRVGADVALLVLAGVALGLAWERRSVTASDER